MRVQPVYKTFGRRVKRIRKFLEQTQEETAKRLKMSRPSLVNIEHGRQRILLHDVQSFAKAFGMKPEQLLRGVMK